MGNVGLTTPRVVLQNELQLHLKGARVKKDVAEIVKAWFEDGAPLGLTKEMFEQVFRLQGRPVATFFNTFDTDGNRKVDAFEAFAVTIILANGTVDEKIESIFPIFDFSGQGRLNFDETNILVHSVYRGLQKVCGTAPVEDAAIIEVCQQLFDAHNLPYDKQVTKEQVKRWLRNDIEASKFIDVFHNGHSLPDLEESLAQREQVQAALFTQLCGSTSRDTVPVDSLLRSDAFRHSLDGPSDEALRFLVNVMAGPSGEQVVRLEQFAKVVRAWNVFTVADPAGEDALDVKELGLLLRLLNRGEPTAEEVASLMEAMKLSKEETLTRGMWMTASLGL
mmetsp:Transcript_157923/g.287768  ORF Transcript_157923/g.287768 Transcript_157923/m.287768 type:complete len:335 (+) Transcript_157923:39-1043(+)